MYTAAVLLTALLVALLWPRLGARWFRRSGSAFERVARRRALSVALVGCTAFFVCAAMSLLGRMPPLAIIGDEYSYLLAADTYAHGRLTNPTHPLWMHFETLHVIQQPTYTSKYPPGQGLMLAAGQVLTGYPIVGVWLGVALACAAICWMLYAWVPPRWALLGGLVAAVHPVCSVEWSQIYWGGGLGMLGGALLLGGFRRIVGPRRTGSSRPRNAAWMGIGVAILALSRPYEGGVLGLLVCGTLLVWLIRERRDRGWIAGLGRIAIPFVLPLLLLGIGLGRYNRAVTGSPLRLPYMAHVAQYDVAPLFLWQNNLRRHTYRHETLRVFWEDLQVPTYTTQRASIRGFAGVAREKVQATARILYSFPVLVIALAAALAYALRAPGERWALWGFVVLAGFVAALLAETFSNTHYAAPAVGLMFALALIGLRCLHGWRPRGRAVGRAITRAVPLLCALSLLHSGLAQARQPRPVWPDARASAERRARIESDLAASAGRPGGKRQLVIVRYGADYPFNFEWISNRADIDRAPVVWAREMSAAENRRLLRYFRDREAWLLELGARSARLVPYPSPGTRAPAVHQATEPPHAQPSEGTSG